ncbi:MAG: hypothetical protein KDK39_01450 [Leptospiraceae bacterium]|nr:hypothetical protein [Leptospiraceae bacterium]
MSSEMDNQNPHITADKVREFRRGNINFDFLQPDGASLEYEQTEPALDRRTRQREGKRGLFNRGRRLHRIGPLVKYFWLLGCLLCLGGIIVSLVLHLSLWPLVTIPVFGLGALFSLMMFVLIQARPS